MAGHYDYDADDRSARDAGGRSPAPPPRRGPGVFGNLVGVVGGGILGTLAGYWLLNYFGGPRFDFLDIPLPGIAHTQPGWVDPEQREPATPVGPLAAGNDERFAPSEFSSDRPPGARSDHDDVLPSRPADESDEPPPLGPRDAPSYSSDELAAALVQANGAIGCAACNSTGFTSRVVVTGVREVNGRPIEQKAEKQVPCEVCGGHPETRITPDGYRALCRLAQRATFVHFEADEEGLGTRKAAVRQLLLRAAAAREHRNALGRLAGFWLNSPNRDEAGAVLAGTVNEVRQAGSLDELRLVLFGQPVEVTVVSAIRGPLQPGDRAVVAGAIVEQPAANLVGYEGNEPVVIWGGMAVKLSQP
jgi:hypothetical protein